MDGRAGDPVVRQPVRTCIGCRDRAPREALVRLAAVPAAPARPEADGEGGAERSGRRTAGRSGTRVVPDLSRGLPGRGAHLHPDRACVERAVQRRAIPRALRLPGDVDLGEVITWAQGLTASDEQTRGQDMEAGHTR
ncbi:YlxR family protein [Kytococcus sp. Marseille-QA3725]